MKSRQESKIVSTFLFLLLTALLTPTLASANKDKIHDKASILIDLNRIQLPGRTDKERLTLIKQYENIAYYEVADAYIQTIAREVMETKDRLQDTRVDVIKACLEGLSFIGTQEMINQYHTYVRDAIEAHLFKDMKLYALLQEAVEQTELAMEKRHDSLPRLGIDIDAAFRNSGQALVVVKPTNKNSNGDDKDKQSFLLAQTIRPKTMAEAREAQVRIQKHMDVSVFDQEEIVQALMDIENENTLFWGKRTEPPLLFLMGPSSVGIETLVQEYVDAKYEHKGAWKDHLFTVPEVSDKASLWSLVGSATGYVGSENISPLNRFIVEHSGGRYQLMEQKGSGGGSTTFVVENPEWKKNRLPLEGKLASEMATIFIPNFDQWPKKGKDEVLLKALKEGRFPINNPGPGVSYLEFQGLIVVSTSEGMELVTSTKPNGRSVGQPLSYEDQLKRWEEKHTDKKGLLNILQSSTSESALKQSNDPYEAKGTSPELIKMIPENRVFLKKPITLKTRELIVEKLLNQIRNDFKNADNLFGPIELVYAEDLHLKIANFPHDPEKQAGALNQLAASFVRQPILQAISEEKIVESKKGQKLFVDIVENPDRTMNLKIEVTNPDLSRKADLSVPIQASLSNKIREPISKEEMDRLFEFEGFLNQNVFNIKEVAKRLATKMISLMSQKNSKVALPASILSYFGVSSSGKTETTKAEAKFFFKDSTRIKSINFSEVRTVQAIQQLILGYRNGNDIVRSEFMEYYDLYGGDVQFTFDELSNAPADVLKALYDIFREGEITFADGVKRTMTNVRIRITGNIGEEIYKDIPKHLPDNIRMAAMEEAYKNFIGSPGLQRMYLEKAFSDALINRMGLENIFWYAPLNFKSLRELSVLKLKLALDRLHHQEGALGWKIQFASEKAFWDLVEIIETDGFIIEEQGASIDRFIKDSFETHLRVLLTDATRKGKIKNQDTVILQETPTKTEQTNEMTGKHNHHSLKLVSGKEEMVLELKGKSQSHHVQHDEEEQILTAYHEAGHDFLTHALFGPRFSALKLSILPG